MKSFLKNNYAYLFIIIFLSGCIKNDYDTSDSGSASTTPNINKTYMPGVNLKKFAGYIGETYSTLKSELDPLYVDTAYISEGNETLLIEVQDSTEPGIYYSLVIYQNGETVYAVDVQNLVTVDGPTIWQTSFALADSTAVFAGTPTSGNIYDASSNSVASYPSIDNLEAVYEKNISTFSAYTLEILWDESTTSYAIESYPSSNEFYWIAQKGNISTTTSFKNSIPKISVAKLR